MEKKPMINFNCDMCGKPLLVQEDVRYVVKIEVFAAYDTMEITEEDIREDHSEEMCRLCEQMEHTNPEDAENAVYKTLQLDLCPDCQKIYLKNPLPLHRPRRGAKRFGEN
jgi:hypothetical protein